MQLLRAAFWNNVSWGPVCSVMVISNPDIVLFSCHLMECYSPELQPGPHCPDVRGLNQILSSQHSED